MTFATTLCRLSLVGVLLVGSRAVFAAAPNPATEEVREYEVLVKQKPSGKVTIRIAAAQDGTTVATTETAVQAEFVLLKYRYEYHGQETWQGDRLLKLESRTNDNGKPLAVVAAVDANRSRIEIKGTPSSSSIGPLLAMTSNYWRLPDARLAADKFSIIDSDTGTLFTVRLQHVGPDSVVVEGRKIACEHFRISGDTAAELWFDGEHRLVRQQTVEQGYTTELRLARVRTTVARE